MVNSTCVLLPHRACIYSRHLMKASPHYQTMAVERWSDMEAFIVWALGYKIMNIA